MTSHVDEGRLHAFLDGELDEALAAEIEEHLAGCAACERVLEEAARVHAVSASLIAEASLAAGGPDWSEMLERAARDERSARRADDERSPSRAWRPPGSFLIPAVAWAATLVLAFGLGWQARQSGSLAGQSPESAMAPAPARGGSPQTGAEQAAAESPEGEAGQVPAAKKLDLDDRVDSLEQDTLAATGAIDNATPMQSVEAEEAPPTALVSLRDAAEELEDGRQNIGGTAGTSGAVGERERAVLRAQSPPPAVPVLAPPAPAASEQRKASFRMLESRAEEVLADGNEVPLAEFESIDLGTAAERLGGEPLRLPLTEVRSAAIGPPAAIEGAAPDRPVLRLVFDYSGRSAEVTLMQQFVGVPARAVPAALDAALLGSEDREQQLMRRRDSAEPVDESAPLLSADLASTLQEVVLTVLPSGARRLSWRDERGYLLVLVADLDEEDLVRLAESLR